MTAKIMNLMETANEARVFKTLVKLLETAKLSETLSKRGPYTVFAPTDMAFSKVPKKDMESLLKDGDKLKLILLNHVIRGGVTVEQALKLKGLETASGIFSKVRLADGKPMIGNSIIVETDIKVSNGFIHIVDSVLMP